MLVFDALPPPLHNLFAFVRTCDMRSARKRILASNRAVVGSTLVARR